MNSTIEEFVSFPNDRIKKYVKRRNINSVYLPIDGTRRYFVMTTGLDYSSPQFFDKYFENVIPRTIELLKSFYELGIEHIVLLLMDNTAFSRGEKYLQAAINLGIKPTTKDNRFLDFYKEYDLDVFFAGDNNLYTKHGFGSLVGEFNDINNNINGHRTLTYYTGTSSQMDYMMVWEKYLHGEDPTKLTYDELLIKIYGRTIPKIDFSMFFGHPRDKILPPLLWGNSINFYTKNPSLAVNNTQIRKMLYYTIKSRNSIKDKYIEYKNKEIISANEKLKTPNLIGEEFYP